MMLKILQFLNRNSYLVLASLLLLVVGAVSYGNSGIFLTIVVLAVFALLLYLFFHRRAVDEKPAVAQTLALAADGKPTLIEFYSDY